MSRSTEPSIYYFHSNSFADAIVPELCTRIVGHRIRSINGLYLQRPSFVNRFRVRLYRDYRQYRTTRHLLTLGSILHHARDGDVIWGAGFNPVWREERPTDFKLDVRAVRGPLTGEYVREVLGLRCPAVYGDPALLLPQLFPEFRRTGGGGNLVLAQHNDEPYLARMGAVETYPALLLCQRKRRLPWHKVVRAILSADYVISSSLHGVIIAEAFGIPARWWHSEELPSAKTEGRFKFNDYYLATGRSPDNFVETIEEAELLGPPKVKMDFNSANLLSSFPLELFQ